jgi:hypothetical protein
MLGRGATIANHGFDELEDVKRDPVARRRLAMGGVKNLLKRQTPRRAFP